MFGLPGRSLPPPIRIKAGKLDKEGDVPYQQLAACNSTPYSGWFAPLAIPPGSPAALGRRKAQSVTETPPYEALEKGQCVLEE